MDIIEIPFGAKDSELKGWEYTIPEGMEAVIENGKVIVRQKESEDERIRREIVGFICWAFNNGSITNEHRERSDSWLAYLEKQKEQKPNIELIQRSWYMEGYTDGKFKRESMWNLVTGEGGPRYEKNEKYGQPLEQKSAEWSKEDEMMCNDIIDYMLPMPLFFMSSEGKSGKEYTKEFMDKAVDWLRALPLKLKKQNEDVAKLCSNEWSEEDKEMIQLIITDVVCQETAGNITPSESKERIAWLKSFCPPFKDREMKLKILKYLSTRCSSLEFEEIEYYLNDLRPSWKPSEEQMAILNKVYHYLWNDYNSTADMQDGLGDLIDELKEL